MKTELTICAKGDLTEVLKKELLIIDKTKIELPIKLHKCKNLSTWFYTITFNGLSSTIISHIGREIKKKGSKVQYCTLISEKDTRPLSRC